MVEGDPSRLGPFVIVRRLGEGGQGVVFLGEGPSGEQVAIKLLHTRLTADADARSRFLHEVALAQRVARFCTAPVLYADLAGNQPYIVSEFVPGKSLRDLVEEEGPRRGAALDRLAISTATALAAIHRAGITHRDFKPANVLMGPEGPVVIDFGVAKALDSPQTTGTGTTMGTPSYLAPELMSTGVATGSSDVFAWAVTIVYAATGKPAFGADSIPQVMHRILTSPPDLGELSGPLRDLMRVCLAKDPALRPTAEAIVAHLTGGPAIDLTPSAPGRRRKPVLLAAAVTAAALAVTAAAVITLRPSEPAGPSPTPAAALPSAAPPPSPSPRRPSATRSVRQQPAPTRSTVVPVKQALPVKTPSPSPSPTPSPSPSPSVTPTVKPTVPPTPNPRNPRGLCGWAFKIVDSHGWNGKGTTYLLVNESTGRACVVTLSTNVMPGKVRMGVSLRVQGGQNASDWRRHSTHTGPIKLPAAGKCVIWGGGYGQATWKSAWSHCGS
ncbi:hypothetical protein Amac_046390 [Acrocarpospora macrocephala]|uniref:Protein kinase domain-containing protein n=1 Tax=Acrocarpospora macrocephala TaxID=150177 RepID=A0A5M3WSA4_9ACTN|nr:hypothetical protein Amac_046390 [Acrocarpospora macrocephala]